MDKAITIGLLQGFILELNVLKNTNFLEKPELAELVLARACTHAHLLNVSVRSQSRTSSLRSLLRMLAWRNERLSKDPFEGRFWLVDLDTMQMTGSTR